MLVFLTAEKNKAMSAPSAIPPNAVALTLWMVNGEPRSRIQMISARLNIQNR